MMQDDMRMAQPPPTESVRLIFEFEGGEIRLVSQQPVDMAPPPGEPAMAAEEALGFFAEVRGADEQVLYRRLVADPVAQYPEVFSEEPGQTIARADTPLEKGAFTVVVPSVPDGDHLSFVRSEAVPGAAMAGLAPVSSAEVARFSLKAGRKPRRRRTS